MPKYIFECSSCSISAHKYVPANIDTVTCEKCGSKMNRTLPNISSTTEVREIIDPYTNTTWVKDQQDILKKRKEDYYWEVEVPRFVEKYSIETCLEQGWLIYNDKGELVINKPPSKR